MKFNQYDRCVCVSVDTRYPESKHKIDNIMNPMGVSVYYYVNGITEIDRIGRENYDLIHDHPKPDYFKSYYGCYYHMLARKKIIDQALSDGLENILIIEDDLELIPEFHDILSITISQIPERWDILYYGAYHKWAETTVIDTNLLKLNGSAGTHCIGFNKSVFQTILDFPGINTFDNEMQAIHKEFQVYCVWPSVAVQSYGVSSITGKMPSSPLLFKYKGTNHPPPS